MSTARSAATLIALALLGPIPAQAGLAPPLPPDPGAHTPYCAYEEPGGAVVFDQAAARILRPASDDDCLAWPAGTFPLVVIFHGNGYVYDRYLYLASHLARNGFVTAMVVDDRAAGPADEVADQVLTLLGELGAWGDAAKLDGRLALVGHSRGGEGVVRAAQRFHDEGWSGDLRAVVDLAGTDEFRLKPSAAQIPALLAMTASRDSDTMAHDPDIAPPDGRGTPFAQYDRTGGERAHVHIAGGIHHGFSDYDAVVGYEAEISMADQRTVVRTYVTAFLRWQVLGHPYRGLFTGDLLSPTAEATGVEWTLAYDDPSAVVLSRFDGGVYANGSVLNSLGWSGLDATLTDLWALETDAISHPWSSPHDSAGLGLIWDGPGTVSLELGGLDASATDTLSFRVAQLYDSIWNDRADLDFTIEVRDQAGGYGAVSLADWAEVAYPEVFITPAEPEGSQAPGLNRTMSPMQTVRIPLAAFGVDATQLDGVTFRFGDGAVPTGEITLDDITLSD